MSLTKEQEIRLAELNAQAAKEIAVSRTKLLCTAVIAPIALMMGMLALKNAQQPEKLKKDYSLFYMAGFFTIGLARTYITIGFVDSYLSKRHLKKMTAHTRA